MYSKETSRIVENTLISYLDRNISALKNGERFEVFSRNTGINYCNLVHYIFCTRGKTLFAKTGCKSLADYKQ